MTTRADTAAVTSAHTPDGEAVHPIGLTALDVALALAAAWRRLVVGPLLCGVVAVAVSFLVTKTYTSAALLMPPAQSAAGLGGLAASLGGSALPLLGAAGSLFKDPADQWIGLLRSREMADALVDRFDLVRLYGVEFRFQARERLQERTRIGLTRQGLISVEVDDADPRRAQAMAAAYVEILQGLADRVAVESASKRREFLERQLATASDRLATAELRLRGAAVRSEDLKVSPQVAAESVVEVQRSLFALELQMAALRTTFTEDSPQVRQALARVEQLRRRLQQLRAASADPPAARSAASSATRPVDSSQDDDGYVGRYRAFKYAEVLVEGLVRQLELARLEEARQGTPVQVVDRPITPEWKSKPKRAIWGLVATLSALMIMILHELTRAWWRAGLQDPERAPRLRALQGHLRLRKA